MDAQSKQTDFISIAIPGSKSLSHRYLIGAGLAKGKSVLSHVQDSADITVTKRLLQQLGVEIVKQDEETLIVTGIDGKVRGGEGSPMECNVEESGTTCRLMSAVLAAGNGLFRIYGSGRMSERPCEDLCNALTRLGAGVCYTGKSGCPPFLLQARGLDPDLVKGELSIGMDSSSQYFSGLLLAAPLSNKDLVLELGGKKAVSWPYVSLTLACLSDYGLHFTAETRQNAGSPWQRLEEGAWREIAMVEPGCLRITVEKGSYRAGNFTVEGDWSSASYFLAAGALGKKGVCLKGLREDSLQGDRIFLDILCKMGAEVKSTSDSVCVFPSPLHGVDLDMGYSPDLVPTVAVMAAFAHGSTRIRNVAHLKLKETDRIAASAKELNRIGVIVDTLSDGLLINGRGDHISHKIGHAHLPVLAEHEQFECHNDHRIAMSLALLDVVNPDLHVQTRLDAPDCVGKSFPTFWELWDQVRQCQ